MFHHPGQRYVDAKQIVAQEGMVFLPLIIHVYASGFEYGIYRAMRALLREFVDAVAAPDYLALLPYMQRTPERDKVLFALRLALRNRCQVATTLGYGPRYLHSTGQLHKGGPPTGVLLMFTADAPDDLPIPGEPFGFATLQRAQALGDFQALSAAGRRVLRLPLGYNIEQGLQHAVNNVL